MGYRKVGRRLMQEETGNRVDLDVGIRVGPCELVQVLGRPFCKRRIGLSWLEFHLGVVVGLLLR